MNLYIAAEIKRRMYVLLLFCLSTNVAAQQMPRWELGLALAGQALRDYRGSSERQVQAYPIPLLIYRGKILKADREGLRGEFLANNRIEFNLSGETALNGGSGDNELREGMPQLESAFELGPSININLTGDDFRSGWQLRLPLRAVVTAGDSGVHHRGYTFNPRFTYTEPNIFNHWRWRINVGLLYGSNRYHDYYYTVAEEFVTETRPRYEAEGGFSGYYFKTSLSRRTRKFWYGVSLRYDNLSDATFEDSPLVETRNYFALSFIFAWMNWRSEN